LLVFLVTAEAPGNTEVENNGDTENQEPVEFDTLLKLQTEDETHKHADHKREWKNDGEKKQFLFGIHSEAPLGYDGERLSGWFPCPCMAGHRKRGGKFAPIIS
jgi:hypothetical protein